MPKTFDRWHLGLDIDDTEAQLLDTVRRVNENEFAELARNIDEASTGSEEHYRLSLAWVSRCEQLGLWGLAVPADGKVVASSSASKQMVRSGVPSPP